jgi:putative addiction module killer protein
MTRVIESLEFAGWLARVRDLATRTRIMAKIQRLQEGNRGDVSPVGGGVFELRMHFGPGYRVYFVEREQDVVLLLVGGDKGTQRRDIAKAIWLSRLI